MSADARLVKLARSNPASSATFCLVTSSRPRSFDGLLSAPLCLSAETSAARNACCLRVRSRSVKFSSLMSRRCRTNAMACAASICCTPLRKSAPEYGSDVSSLRHTVIGATALAISKNAPRVTSTKWSMGIPSRFRTVAISALRPASRAFCSRVAGSSSSDSVASISAW